MYEGIDTVVLQNELAFEDELPFVWRPCQLPLSAALQHRHTESNVRLLQVCLTLDDQSAPEKKAEDAQQSVELARLDMKMNLLLDLVGKLVLQNHPRSVPAKLRLNAHGAAWHAPKSQDERAKAGDPGIFEVYLHEYLLDPLRLAAKVARIEGDRVEVRFERAPDTVTDLIDKLTFRRHRRQIAVKRQPRSS